MTLARIPAAEVSPRPWHQRPGETTAEWLEWLFWTFRYPRPAPSNPALASRNAWQFRTASIDARLGTIDETPREALGHVASDALVVLRNEMSAKAAQSVSSPGSVPLGELVQLLKLAAELGATSVVDDEGDWDLSALTPDERLELARLLAKLRPRGG